jgi:phosphate:Na+ symporter
MHDLVASAIDTMVSNLEENYNKVKIDQALNKENAIDELRNQLRSEDLVNMQDKKYNSQIGALYRDIYQSMEKVGDHVINVTEAITGDTMREIRKQEGIGN